MCETIDTDIGAGAHVLAQPHVGLRHGLARPLLCTLRSPVLMVSTFSSSPHTRTPYNVTVMYVQDISGAREAASATKVTDDAEEPADVSALAQQPVKSIEGLCSLYHESS